MARERKPAPNAPEQVAESPRVVHADGTLTVTADAVEVDVTKGGGYRGLIAVPRDRCTLRVMGRAIAVFDGGQLVHLCSRCKPMAEVARLVAELGEQATSEPRTPFATLLALREESAAYRPAGGREREREEPPVGGAEQPPAPEEPADVPPGHESLRRVYFSRSEMDRDSRRLRAAGWVAHQVSLNEEVPAGGEGESHRAGRLGRLLRAANPSREVTEGVIVWIRPLDASITD